MLLIDHSRQYMTEKGIVPKGEEFRLRDSAAEALLKTHDTLERVEEIADEFEEIEDSTPVPHDDAPPICKDLLTSERGEGSSLIVNEKSAESVSDAAESEDEAEDAEASESAESAESAASDTQNDDSEPAPPVKLKGGWYEYDGAKFRKKDLIAAGVLTE